MTAPVPVLREDASGRAGQLELASWRDRFGIVAGVTTREGGADYGLLTPAPADAVVGRWRDFASGWGAAFPTVVVGLQVHGREIAIHEASPRGWLIRDGTDGHATTREGTLLAVTVADCVPVYLADPGSGAVALLHVGWRGAAAGMLEAGLAALADLGTGSMSSVVMHCGVAICGDCYEVGPEVIAAVTGRASPGPARLDLRAALAGRARAAGVREVTVSDWCSGHHGDRFHSHRRSGGRDGRMIAFAGRPLA